jgi:preprotein translocase subunit YajC
MSEVVDQIAKIVEEALQGPLALPILVGLATVLFTVVLFYSVSKSGKKQKKRRSSKADAVDGGTTVVDGVRRSTR